MNAPAPLLGPSPGARWVIDRRRVTVVTPDGRAHVLEGVEAVVWEWISVSAAQPRLVEFVAQLTGSGTAEAETLLGDLLARWRNARLLEPARIPGRRDG